MRTRRSGLGNRPTRSSRAPGCPDSRSTSSGDRPRPPRRRGLRAQLGAPEGERAGLARRGGVLAGCGFELRPRSPRARATARRPRSSRSSALYARASGIEVEHPAIGVRAPAGLSSTPSNRSQHLGGGVAAACTASTCSRAALEDQAQVLPAARRRAGAARARCRRARRRGRCRARAAKPPPPCSGVHQPLVESSATSTTDSGACAGRAGPRRRPRSLTARRLSSCAARSSRPTARRPAHQLAPVVGVAGAASRTRTPRRSRSADP